MRHLKSNFIYVSLREELNPNSTWIMQNASPGFIGMVYQFTSTEKGQERFREFINREGHNSILVGKAHGYRVYVVIHCTRDIYDNQAEGIECHIQTIASEMADFYVQTGLKSEVQRAKYVDNPIL